MEQAILFLRLLISLDIFLWRTAWSCLAEIKCVKNQKTYIEDIDLTLSLMDSCVALQSFTMNFWIFFKQFFVEQCWKLSPLIFLSSPSCMISL